VRFLGTPPTQGAFRELITHPAHLLAELPDSMSDDLGALLEPLAIGVHATQLLRLKLGATVVILGAGPVGLCTLLAARLSAPAKLIVVEPLAYRRELARELGADLVFSPEDPDLLADIRKATGGYGAKYVFEAVGTLDSFHRMIDVAEPGAKIGAIGIEPGDHFGFNNSVARRKGLTIFMVRRSRNTLEKAIEITARGYWHPEPLITHHLGLGDLAKGMDMVEEYADGVVKAMVDPRR
jgi:L-iditol 2-dehydrogenase